MMMTVQCISDWLIDRKKLPSKWQDSIRKIREQINAALGELPDVAEITDLLKGKCKFSIYIHVLGFCFICPYPDTWLIPPSNHPSRYPLLSLPTDNGIIRSSPRRSSEKHLWHVYKQSLAYMGSCTPGVPERKCLFR